MEDKTPVQLLPEYFAMENGEQPPLLDELKTAAKGIALLPLSQVETLASVGNYLSQDECAAVVAGVCPPSVASFKCEPISFIAEHLEAGKVLLKGHLVNFGEKVVKLHSPAANIELSEKEARVITIEIVRKFCPDWRKVASNPLRCAWAAVPGLQKGLLSTWSRKFFCERKLSSPEEAQTWHCFGKVVADQLPDILMASGNEGIFVNPKLAQGGADNRFKVIWADHDSLAKAQTIAKTHPSIKGLVHGKSSLGFRVQATEYSATRLRLDPSWQKDEILKYDLVVQFRYLMTPLPLDVDKGMVQEILNQMGWLATPLRQVGPASWLVGAQEEPKSEVMTFRGQMVLLTKETIKDTGKTTHSAALAAPTSLKKSLDRRFKAEDNSIWSHAARGSQLLGVPVPKPAPQIALQQDVETKINAANVLMQTEIESKMDKTNEEWRQAMQELEARMQVTIQQSQHQQQVELARLQELHAQETVKAENAAKAVDNRLNTLQADVQGLAQAMCSKQDMQAILAEALAKQSSDFQRMLSKRSSEPQTPEKRAKVQQ